MKLRGGIGRSNAPVWETSDQLQCQRLELPSDKAPRDDCPIVAEISTLPNIKIHRLLDVIYLPCRIKTRGAQNLASGNVSEISVTSTTVGNKTCAIVPYKDTPGPQISLGGFCVCPSCLKKMPHATTQEREETLNMLWKMAVAPILLTTGYGNE
jgi:hypothetical protein